MVNKSVNASISLRFISPSKRVSKAVRLSTPFPYCSSVQKDQIMLSRNIKLSSFEYIL